MLTAIIFNKDQMLFAVSYQYTSLSRFIFIVSRTIIWSVHRPKKNKTLFEITLESYHKQRTHSERKSTRNEHFHLLVCTLEQCSYTAYSDNGWQFSRLQAACDEILTQIPTHKISNTSTCELTEWERTTKRAKRWRATEVERGITKNNSMWFTQCVYYEQMFMGNVFTTNMLTNGYSNISKGIAAFTHRHSFYFHDNLFLLMWIRQKWPKKVHLDGSTWAEWKQNRTKGKLVVAHTMNSLIWFIHIWWRERESAHESMRFSIENRW